MTSKRIILIILSAVLTGCFTLQTQLPSEKIKSETERVIEIIRTQPDWLKENNICPKDIIPNKEKEVSYLDEGCENNPGKCLEDCKGNNANACYALALLIQTRIDFKQEEANPLFSRACQLGVISGCTNRAASNFTPENANSDSGKCSIDTFEKTCEKDDPWGCTMFGMVLAQGSGRPRNLDKALKILSKSCKYGDEDEACQNAKAIIGQIKDLQNKKK